MKSPSSKQPADPVRWAEAWIAWEPPFAEAISRRSVAFVLMLVIMGLEAGALLTDAAGKPFWYDELLTSYVSGLRPFSLIWQALSAGVDGTPPGFVGLTLAARMLPGDIHVLLRLPSIIGYLLCLWGVYWFTTKRLPPAAGLIAVLLVALTPFREYAVEARGYALMVGSLAMAAAVWQRIEERWWMPLLFSLGLALASSCHYYAMLAFVCFALAEVVASFFLRRVRWAVWGAFLLASIPFLVCLPVLLRYRLAFGTHFWSKPTLKEVLFPYFPFSGVQDILATVLLLFWVLTMCRRLARQFRQQRAAAGFPPSEIILIGCFLSYASVLCILTMVQHGGYTYRYGWPVILGIAWAVASLTRPSWLRFASAPLVLALLLGFAWQDYRDFREFVLGTTERAEVQAQWSMLEDVSKKDPAIPVVIGNAHTYLQMVQYAAPSLRDRIVHLDDAEEGVRWTGRDSTDRNDLILRRFVPLNIQGPAPFLAAHKRFYVDSRRGVESWLTRYLLAHGYQLTLVADAPNNSVYLAEQ